MDSSLESLFKECRAKGWKLTGFLLDGKAHRFKVSEDDRKKSGSYRAVVTALGTSIHLTNFKNPEDNRAVVIHGHDTLTPAELKKIQKEVDAKIKEEEKKSFLKHQKVANECRARWERADPTQVHSKLLLRQLTQAYGSRVDGAALLCPLYDIDGVLWGLEIHYAERHIPSRFTPGCKSKGMMHMIGEVRDGEPIFVSEGFVTAAFAHQISGHTFVCSYSANNMVEVAETLRQRYPQHEIILSGDNDKIGWEKSKLAAKLVGGRILIPDFGMSHPDFTDWNDFQKPELLGGIKMAVSQLSDYKKQSQAADFELFFQEWMKRNEVTMDYRGNFKILGEEKKIDFVSARLYLDANSSSKTYGTNHVKAALKIWQQDKKAELQRELISVVQGYEPNEELEKFVTALTDENISLSISIMKHWIWQVKRKMLRIPVHNHMMIVITGPQASGKSRAVAALTKPIHLLTASKDVPSLCDSKQYPMFEDHFVIVCDEMARADAADINHLKTVITSDELLTRKYYSQDQAYIRNNCTIIGTSNTMLEGILSDSTGMRRFFEIRSKKVCDWDAINSIDYVKLWKSVDVNEKNYLVGNESALSEAQEIYRKRTDFEEWIRQSEISPSSNSYFNIATLRKESFVKFCEENGIQERFIMNTRNFAMAFRQARFKVIECKARGANRDKLVVYASAYGTGVQQFFDDETPSPQN